MARARVALLKNIDRIRETRREKTGNMESDRFDSLARTLAEALPSRTRRSTAGLLIGGLLAGVPAVRDVAGARSRRSDVAAEKKGGKGKKKKKKDKKDDKKCGNGEQLCGDTCVNLQSDRNNCGTCGRLCTETEDCINGGCFGCFDPLIRCGGDECFDPKSNNQHCGGCNRPCAANEECINGFCACAGPQCSRGNGETRCCPAAGGVCCAGSAGTCCHSGEVCTPMGGCCPQGSYGCADGIHCCPNGLVCRGNQCTLR